MGDLELAVIARDSNMFPGNSTLDLRDTITEMNLAPVPWYDPMFYISIMIIVAFIMSILYNLWTREND